MKINFYNKKQFFLNKQDIERLNDIFLLIKKTLNLPYYEVELEIVDTKKIKEINKKYRKINESTDVLSFSFLGEFYCCQLGVIFIAYDEINKFSNYGFLHNLCFLFIHGILHLLGYDHGDEMFQLQQKIISSFFSKYLVI